MKLTNHIVIGIVFAFVFFKGSAQLVDENSRLINDYFQTFEKISIKSPKVKELNKYNVSIVSITQKGSNNEVEINKKGKDSQVVYQIGNNNQYNFINYYNNTPLNLNVFQRGNSNSLQIYGKNSIINDISIIQKSNFKTLIIKNY